MRVQAAHGVPGKYAQRLRNANAFDPPRTELPRDGSASCNS